MWDAWLCKPDGSRLFFLNEIVRGEITKPINQPGMIDITGDLSDIRPWELTDDMVIDVWRTNRVGVKQRILAGFMRGWQVTEAENHKKLLSLRGPGVGELIGRHIVDYPVGTVYSDKTDYADDMMKAFMRENFVSDIIIPARNLAASLGFTVFADQSLGPLISIVDMGWVNIQLVLEKVSAAAYESGIPVYFGIEPYTTAVGKIGLSFVTWIGQPGRDRTKIDRVTFGDTYGNVKDPSLTYSSFDERNVGRVGGAGEGVDRITAYIGMRSRYNASLYNRRELFINASDVSGIPEMSEIAYHALHELMPFYLFEATLIDGETSRYGIDWAWGDKVKVEYSGLQFTSLVDNVRFAIEGQNETIEAKFSGQIGIVTP